MRPKRIFVDGEFAKELKILAAKCDKSVIALTKTIKLNPPPKTTFNSKKPRWIDL